MTDYRKLYDGMLIAAEQDHYSINVCTDLTNLLVNWHKEHKTSMEPYKRASEVLNLQSRAMRRCIDRSDFRTAERFRDLIFSSLKFSAPKNFDHYIQGLEYDREPSTRFYLPRRNVLLGHVRALQAIADGELDELFLSQPPRTGKTCLTTFYYTWIFGRNSEPSNLYVSYSDALTTSFYNGIIETLTDSYTYKWNEMFPAASIAGKNAKEETLDVDRVKKYHTITCRSLYGTLNGACDCTGTLTADDLLSGIEEALNPDRLETAWLHVDNNMLTRAANDKTKIIWVGTRWSVGDPIGRRIDLLESDPRFAKRRYKIINIPALNENDESNFMYKGENVVLTTEYFLQRRASFERNNDMASWFAQFQGEPIEREGTLFDVDGFMYYNGILPEREPDRVFMAVDPAFGGGDYTAGPIIYQYGRECYVVDVIYNNGDKSVTQPLIAQKAVTYKVGTVRFEANKTVRPYVEGVEKEMDRLEGHVNVFTKPAPPTTAKAQRIFDKAPDIRNYFIFLDTAHRTKEYNQFMQNVFSFKTTGKNKHDDAPDSLAMAADMLFKDSAAKVTVFQRPF